MHLHRKILNYLLPYWKYMLVSAISMIIFALLSGAMIWLLGPLMGTLFEHESTFGIGEQVENAGQVQD